MVEPGGFEPLPIKDEIYSLAAVSKTTFSLHLMDAMAGIEPAFTTSKADVLPLDDIAIFFIWSSVQELNLSLSVISRMFYQ